MHFRALGAIFLAGFLGAPPPPLAAQAGRPGAPFTILSPEGRHPLASTVVGGHDMVSLADLAALFHLDVEEDRLAGGLTVTHGGQTIVLTPGQTLASVSGRLVSLPSPPARDGQTWLVPIEFLSRALAPIADRRIEVRRDTRLIILGDLRVPQISARHESLGAQARISLEVAPATPHAVTRDRDQLVVTFEADALDARLPEIAAGDLVGGIRIASPTTIAIQLGPRLGSFRAIDVPGERGAERLVIDLLPEQVVAEAPAPPDPSAPAAPGLPVDLAPPPDLRTIVIDPGHGGDEPGARGPNGGLEKDVTLSVARRLKGAIEGRLGLRVLLTREGDETVSLDRRAAVANNNKADLFLSLHANASARPSASGAEVFYLSLDEYGDLARRAASREAAVLPVFGGGMRTIEVIQWEMAQARYIQESATLAQLVEGQLRQRVPVSARAIQQAPFRVLVGANMPAVLVEMGFITNAEQERQLASESFQNEIAQALLESIIRFRDVVARAGRARTPAAPSLDEDTAAPGTGRHPPPDPPALKR